MSRFGPDPRAFFESVYQGTAPWDVGGPQPALVELFAEHPAASPVLDVGCGSGDLAIHLARAGLDVLGVDFSERAIAQAREKLHAVHRDSARSLDFVVGDALRPSLLGQQFGSVVDSGFLHVFDPEDCDRFADELATVLRPGGRYYLLAFTMKGPRSYAPRGISEEELRGRFSREKGWQIRAMRPAKFHTAIGEMPAVSACIERVAAR